jgi:hypothetical protein
MFEVGYPLLTELNFLIPMARPMDVGPMVKEKRPKEKPWSTMDVFDLRHAIEQGETIEQAAAVLGRPLKEVLHKAEEPGLIHHHGES